MSSCFTTPSPTSLTTPNVDINKLSSWTSSTTCRSNGKCEIGKNTCQCNSGWETDPKLTIPNCNVAIVPCRQCQLDNVATCTPSTIMNIPDKCECKLGWSGDNCSLSTQCLQESDKKCNYPNGQLTTTSSTTCSSTCSCHNLWTGNTCKSCGLICYNGGMRYNDCNRCGCASGYTGNSCQCNGLQGTIVLNGYSDVIVEYLKALNMTTKLDYFDILHDEYQSIYAALTTMFDSLIGLQSETKSSLLKLYTTTDQPPQTRFVIDITFGCSDYNPTMTKTTLQQAWAKMTTTLAQHEVIQQHFIFPEGVSAPIVENTIDDTPESLPPPEDRLPNGLSSSVTLTITLFTTFLSLFITLI